MRIKEREEGDEGENISERFENVRTLKVYVITWMLIILLLFSLNFVIDVGGCRGFRLVMFGSFVGV